MIYYATSAVQTTISNRINPTWALPALLIFATLFHVYTFIRGPSIGYTLIYGAKWMIAHPRLREIVQAVSFLAIVAGFLLDFLAS